MEKMRFPFIVLFFAFFAAPMLQAQSARLGVQGILKKANGNAVDDGNYDLTFKLYNVATGGTALWTETQSDVEVASGVYTVTLGSVTALNVPFNETYYLGVTVGGSTEMSPRIQLTTAPYALSLIGNTNQFPSSGKVIADSLIVKGKMGVGTSALPPAAGQAGGVTMWVDGGIRVAGGAPAANNTTNRGYTFVNNSGDNDSGVFSTADGFVSLYSNASELLRVSGGGTGSPTVNIKTNGLIDNSLTINDQLIVTGLSTLNSDVTLQNNANINYKVGTTTLSDWRLVARDDFSGGSLNGWNAYTDINSGTTTTAPTHTVLGEFSTNSLIRPFSNNDILKKQYDLSAVPHEFIMVKFNYYFIDSWDAADYDRAFAGFATGTGSTVEFAWSSIAGYVSATGTWDFIGNAGYSDHSGVFSMMARNNSNNPVVVFGAVLDNNTNDENYGISNIEIWVR